MIRRVALTIIAVVLVVEFVLSACASVTLAAQLSGAPDVAAWARAVQARTHVPGPAGPAIDVVVLADVPGQPASDGGWVGGAYSTVYLTRRDDATLEHELGHAFEERNLDVKERVWLVDELGFRAGTPWQNPARWTGDLYCQHVACPDEVVADAYAGCALHYRLTTEWGNLLRRGSAQAWWGSYGWRTTRARYAAICSAIHAFADPTPRLEPQTGA